jgi:hypothetical protein
VSKATCENCRFWKRDGEKGDSVLGNCHRCAPARSAVKFPCTEESDWCGEWDWKLIEPAKLGEEEGDVT